jgi:hypothetical protein
MSMACVVVVARRVFLQGGRIAFVISPAFDHTMTAVRLFNGFHCPTGTQPSAAGKNAAASPPPFLLKLISYQDRLGTSIGNR